MREEILIESQPKRVELTDEQAQALVAAGRRLASSKIWWGSTDAEPDPHRSVIRCRHEEQGWVVTVRDAVGVVSVGDLQLIVRPKIDQSHLLFLFSVSGTLPTTVGQRANIRKDDDLWSLVASWFVSSLERLLRRDLMRDYSIVDDELQLVRGQVDAPRTMLNVYSGRVAVACQYDEFLVDTPLNRVLKAAARLVARSPRLDHGLRKRALRSLARMTDVRDLAPADMRATTDRRTGYYRESLAFARHVLLGSGRSFEVGQDLAWTFLIRTPASAEKGVRRLLEEAFRFRWTVGNPGRQIPGTHMTFNPDLVFADGAATGDVKYKLVNPEWSHMRDDLYQAIAFATIYETNHAMVLRFRSDDRAQAPAIRVGKVNVTPFEWDARPSVAPEEAATSLAAEIDLWLSNISSP